METKRYEKMLDCQKFFESAAQSLLSPEAAENLLALVDELGLELSDAQIPLPSFTKAA